jgi:hypothetical protein
MGCLIACPGIAAAQQIFSPDESASKDNFVYSLLPTTPFPSTTYLGASVESTGLHTVYSNIEFDLSAATIGPAEAAFLLLGTRSNVGTPFGSVSSNPAPATPVNVDVYRITSAWLETTPWNGRPDVDPLPVASFTVQSVDEIYSIDVTDTVRSWVNGIHPNFGFQLRQRSVVPVAGAADAAVVFHSAGGAFRPTLLIPEPSAVAMLLLPCCFLRRFRA